MKKLLLLLLGFMCTAGAFAFQKQVSFTIDDLPTVPYGVKDPHHNKEITTGILTHAQQYNIPLMGFVNEGKLYANSQPDSAKIQLLRQWLEAGMELGNHTFSHMNLHQQGVSAFAEDIEKGALISDTLAASYNKKYRYLRHPYLRHGKTKAQHDSLARYMEKNGWVEAPVTIDNEDYNFALAYSKLYEKGDTTGMKNLGAKYIDYMEQMTAFYERNSQDLFGRQIPQVLLLHANLLNAHYIDDLARMFMKRGYSFITLEKALSDTAYKSEITVFNDWGISWLHWWALSKGVEKSFFHDEPTSGF